jgi:hypothetical protein
MPEEIKIPFDFGAAHGRFVCRRHGEQEGGLAIRVDTRPDRPAINRVFCGHCLIEALESMMDRLEMVEASLSSYLATRRLVLEHEIARLTVPMRSKD